MGRGGITLAVRKETAGDKEVPDGRIDGRKTKWNNQKPEARTSERKSRKNDQDGGKVYMMYGNGKMMEDKVWKYGSCKWK